MQKIPLKTFSDELIKTNTNNLSPAIVSKAQNNDKKLICIKNIFFAYIKNKQIR